MPRCSGLVVCAVLILAGSCLGGQNPGAKVAVHVMTHAPKRSCTDVLATIDGCEDITYTLEGGDVDCFPVFFNLTEYRGCEYALSWPGTNTCTFTSCSDLVIGTIANPGDGVSHTWFECQTGGIAIPGWAWIYEPDSARVCVVEHPVTGTISTLDCHDGLDEPSEEPFCAGTGGLAGDDPCGGGRGDGGESPPLLRIARVIEVTDGSTFYMQPIWSPDGRKLAFTKSSFEGLYVRKSDGSGPIREITSAAHSGYKPVWTSGSEAIVLRTRTGVVGQSITLADVETGDITTLVEQAAHPGQPDRNANGDITVTLGGETKVLDREGATFRRLDEFYLPEQAPSRGISLEMDFRTNRVTIVEEDEGRRTEFPRKVLLADLSPGQDKVAFKQGDGNIYVSRLYVSRLDGSRVVCLGRGSGWDWSPDGNRLAYVGAIEENEWTITASELFVVNADGTGLTQLSRTPDQVEHYPVWSPDGMSIAYSTVHTGKILVAVLEEAN